MAGLIDSLTMAARSLQAQQFAMTVTGQNIGNVNTPGYTRRVVDFADVPRSAGGGVEIQSVRAVRDQLLDGRVLMQVPLGAYDAALAEQLTTVEVALGAPGQSIDARLDEFFNAYSDLAENPTSAVARRQVQVAGESLADTFNQTAQRMENARQDADARIRGSVDEINSLTTRIAEINGSLATAKANGDGPTLEDEQGTLVRRLAELAGIHVIPRDNGGVDVTLGNGRPLVVGANPFSVATTPTAPYGYASLTLDGVNVTGEINAGTLGGLLHVRDAVIPGYMTTLDGLAAQTAGAVNGLHASGFDLSGNAAGAFFSYATPVSGTAGAAKALQLDPAIATDNTLIAAASISVSGDNGTARAIAALRQQRVLNGNTATLTDGWGDLVYEVGTDSQRAKTAQDTHDAITREIDALRDQVSGVSLDEEALNLLKFQRAYEANARFFTVADSMLSTLLNTFTGR